MKTLKVDDQKRIRLADIDGSGTTDIIYLGRDSISFWFNQSGNSWSETHRLGVPVVHHAFGADDETGKGMDWWIGGLMD